MEPRAPPDAALAPTGAWMLIVNKGTDHGPVPSVARFLDLGAGA